MPAEPSIAQLKAKAQKDPGSLTPSELAKLERSKRILEGMQAARPSKPLAPPATPVVVGRRRRISARYLRHLPDIAALFVACDRRAETAARRVREELGLSLSAATLSTWRDRSAEFLAAVEDAEMDAANAAKSKPEIRAPRDIAWLQQKQAVLQQEHDGGEITDDARKNLRREIRDTMDAIRREERHIADLRDRQAKRDFARFVERLVDYVKVNHTRKADVIVPVFRSALRSLDNIIRGTA